MNYKSLQIIYFLFLINNFLKVFYFLNSKKNGNMDFILNSYFFQFLPFEVSEELKQQITSKAVDAVRVMFLINFNIIY